MYKCGGGVDGACNNYHNQAVPCRAPTRPICFDDEEKKKQSYSKSESRTESERERARSNQLEEEIVACMQQQLAEAHQLNQELTRSEPEPNHMRSLARLFALLVLSRAL